MARGPKPYYSREPRSDIKIRARLSYDGADFDAELINISLSGGFMLIAKPPDPHTVGALTVFPPVGEPIYFHASVIRVAQKGEPSGCAVKFLNVSPESEGRLAYLIKKLAIPRPQK